MNVVGIIAEYNPMHNGHIYHINQAKKQANADYVIVIMSGAFTEQGNVAVINKMKRAEIAIQNGADMVIELPSIFAVSSSETFAYGAINILNSLNVVTHLAFGAECENISLLQDVAKTYHEHEQEILLSIKDKMKEGINSAAAYSQIMQNHLPNISEDIFLPNNILAVQYLKALYALKSEIKPILIHRLKSNHSDTKLCDTCEYASSTSIREVLCNTSLDEKEKMQKISKVAPENTINYLVKSSYTTNEDLWNILKYAITKLGVSGLKEIQEVSEGLENKIYSSALKSNSYNDFIFNVKSKRYTLSRIKRICVYILLGITKKTYANLKNVNYARILKIKDESSNLLSLINTNSKIPIITKITDEILNRLDSTLKESIQLDILSTNISNTDEPNIDYLNRIK